MIRRSVTPRPDWQRLVEAEGLVWHSADGRPYWDESACYVFDAVQIARDGLRARGLDEEVLLAPLEVASLARQLKRQLRVCHFSDNRVEIRPPPPLGHSANSLNRRHRYLRKGSSK